MQDSKRSFSYRALYLESVRPHKFRAALEYLLYYDVLIRDCHINQDLLAAGNNLPENDIDFDVARDTELEFITNKLSTYRYAANKSSVINSEILLEKLGLFF